MVVNGVIRKLFSCLFLGISLLTGPLAAKNIIFDLNGVVLETNKFAAFRQMGISNIISSALFDGINVKQRIQGRLFDVFDSVCPLEENVHGLQPHHQGRLMPQIMRTWQCGTVENEVILLEVLNHINDPMNLDLFVSHRERTLVANVTKLMFDPQTLAKTRKIIPAGYQLVCDCYNERDEFGQRKHKLYVLSNWDAESFEYVVEKFPALFEMFDGIMISGNVGEMKPFDGIYKTLLAEYRLNAKECIFIDDELENIIAARKHFRDKKEERCIHCPGGLDGNKKLVASVRKQLQDLAVL